MFEICEDEDGLEAVAFKMLDMPEENSDDEEGEGIEEDQKS